MQLISQYKVEEISSTNIDQIKDIYLLFKSTAISQYGFIFEPLSFEDFKQSISSKLLKGFALKTENDYDSFLLYVTEDFSAIEINVIFVKDNIDAQNKRLVLTKALVDKYRSKPNWSVISYPMLGCQNDFIKNIAILGFEFVGQAVVNFSFSDSISLKILNNVKPKSIPDGYTLIQWNDKYFHQAVEVIQEGFSKARDALFDPRFLTTEGTKKVVELITSGAFGPFLSQATTLLKYNGIIEGVCFVNKTNLNLLNIPLIGLKKTSRHKRLGEAMLYNSIQHCLTLLANKTISTAFINAGVDTNNYPAVKMYRKIGFREDYNYAHSYLTKERLEFIDKLSCNQIINI